MSTGARFCLGDRERRPEPLHYKMCGLDDIYLLNGFEIHETAYGPGVSIERADELHKAIGRYIILHRKVLGPKDIRFLRNNLDMTQDELGSILGVTGQTVARYEKGQTEITGPADKLIRVLYALHLLPDNVRSQIAEEIINKKYGSQDIDESGDAPVYFGETERGWATSSLVAA